MIGNQNPRIRIEPDRVGTDGEGAAMLMQAYGVTLDEWQKLVIDCWLGKDISGRYNVTSAGISCPRQNGKNVCLEAREFYGLVINGEKCIHSAHQARTARKAFRRLVNMFTDKSKPEIAKAVKQIRYGAGEESIELINGGIIEFSSRSRQAARGYDGISLVVFDEAQELNDEQLEAVMAVLSASTTGTRQIIYAGTPNYIGCTGDVFRRFRQACIVSDNNGKSGKSSWHEWSIVADSLAEVDLSDKRLWYEANPALGKRLSIEFTEEEFKTLNADGFARERLGWWAKPIVESAVFAIDQELWDSCASDEERPEGKTAYGVKFTPDGSEVVLAGAVIPLDGSKARITLLEVENVGRGLSWLADWLNERYKKTACVVIDGKNGADVLIDKLQSVWKIKGTIVKPTAQNVTTAASMLINDLREGAITWYREQEDLRESALSATKRNINGGWGFGGSNSAAIEACALALYGARTCKRNPARQMRVSAFDIPFTNYWG